MAVAPQHPIWVVGIGADGWNGLGDRARELVSTAPVVLGGERHLGMLPDISGQRRVPWPAPLRAGLPALIAEVDAPMLAAAPGSELLGPIVALASGDPLVSGIATTLIDVLGPDRIGILPAPSSVALARAEMRWAAESHATVSVVGRDVSLVRRELAPGRRILVLSSDEHTPCAVADLLVEAGYDQSELTVLANLGDQEHSETRFFDTASIVSSTKPTFARLTILAITCPPAGAVPALGWTAGLPDEAFEHDGQLTKRDLRASALARLAPVPGEHLWDVGAGAGSVGIEWMRTHPTCTATAIEGHPERAARIARNASRLGVPGLRVVEGRAPDALADLPRPDAVFIGGGATAPGVVEACLAALAPGGRLVLHGVTLETEQLLASLHTQHGGELTRISVETSAPIGSFTGWAPARTVTQWAWAVERGGHPPQLG